MEPGKYKVHQVFHVLAAHKTDWEQGVNRKYQGSGLSVSPSLGIRLCQYLKCLHLERLYTNLCHTSTIFVILDEQKQNSRETTRDEKGGKWIKAVAYSKG
jgi:hypothetical protein